MPTFARLPLIVFPGLILIAGALPAGATGTLRRDPPTAPIRPEGPSTAWASAEASTCVQSRRKLWRAGEGWTVRTVTTCR